MTAWTDVIGWTLVHFLWQGTAIALALAGALRLMRQAPPRVRYGVACGALGIALLAPVLTGTTLLTSGAPLFAPAGEGETLERAPGATAVRASHSGIALAGARAVVPVDAEMFASALSAFVAFWGAGVLLLTLRLASGWRRVRALHLEALSSPASTWLAPALRIANQLGLDRAVHVVDSVRVDTPTVIGWLQPVVLLPVAALANLSPGQVQAILAHELAHIRRHDFVVNLVQTVAETILFYHPAIWWLSNRIRAEREHCCDDIAVNVCGDPVSYAEALTALAAWGRQRVPARAPRPGSPLVVAATSGSLLTRVRRLLGLPDERSRRRPAAFVLASTIVLVLLVGTRLVIVAQSPLPPELATVDRRLGPADVNRILGFDLFPGPVRYASDDPRDSRAWDVTVRDGGGGEMSFVGFTARGLVRYAFALDRIPVVEGPSWLDNESRTIRGETSAVNPTDADLREAIRVALENQFGVTLRRETRLFPVYGLQPIAGDRLGPNIRPSTAECFESGRDTLDTIGPHLYARGQQMPFCGVDHRFTGLSGRRATFEQLARAMRGFNVAPEEPGVPAREVVDQTGLTGVYDFDVALGPMPLAAIATAHPTLGLGFGPMVRTFPQAFEEQLGLRLVPSEAPQDVAVVVAARQPN